MLQKLAGVLRQAERQVTAVLEMRTWICPDGPSHLVDLLSGDPTASSWGVPMSIASTSNVVYLVDLLSGEVVATASNHNGQIQGAKTWSHASSTPGKKTARQALAEGAGKPLADIHPAG